MTALELLSDLRDRGVKLWVDGADLRFSARKGTLGKAAAELLARHKTELVELLKSPSTGAATRDPRAFERADDFARKLAPSLQAIQLQGATTLRSIAAALNRQGIKSPNGGAWHPSSVANLIGRSTEQAFL